MTTERILLGLILAGIAYGCGIILWPFLSAILWAAILAFTTWPIYRRMRRHVRPVMAALAMMALSALFILVPMTVLTSTGISDIPGTIAEIDTLILHVTSANPPPAWMIRIPMAGPHLVNAWHHFSQDMGAFATEVLRPYAGQIAHVTLTVLLRLAGGLAELVIALFVAFFLWLNGDTLGNTIVALIDRIAGPHTTPRLINIIGRTIRGTVYGILGTALIQGVLTGIGMMLAGVPSPVLLAGITAFVAVFPIGAPLVWIPAAIWLGMTHHFGHGLFLALYGVIVISGADHIIRPAFIARGAQLPYLLTVLGVLGGIVTFGGVGIFLGPVLLAVGYTLTSEFAAGPHHRERNPLYLPEPPK
ncbi:AI-2E family transporter [Gluconobacter kanchanaburiensis]|uniref:AI-2E family transporter n=1 Tax=Gluconobacter kanchanaburiensis NBRC 103587 TaxID=1307948 RepID=A0A511B8L7_9PROT|nr:AI-2E family transporter [Gluconobacter kanchanaburiensis]MBF0861162.1 AI-2E family transporter [Gluconobacter kanchanaburiensis]GEK96022.1 AI-2E family transporter [Gluconobacter kanchanaburiensis NBRC 103587]